VPVFGVGCERGVHYHAMQFIEGRALSSVIHEVLSLEGQHDSNASAMSAEELQKWFLLFGVNPLAAFD